MLNLMTFKNRENGDYLTIQGLLEKFTTAEAACKGKDRKPFLELISSLGAYLSQKRLSPLRKKVICEFHEPERVEIEDVRWYKVPGTEALVPSVTEIGKHF
jgi:hypothetical protein